MSRPLPHENVYVRLGPSPIDGIGVFAIRDVPAGTNIFANDVVDIVWVSKEDVSASLVTAEEARLYRDFGIHRDGMIGCPLNFHNLTPGWYLNQPLAGEPPNVSCDDTFNFKATRDIALGEELTISYIEFSLLAE